MAKNHEVMSRKEYPAEYTLLDKLVTSYHQHLLDANIVLVWRFGWKPNKDGQLTLGKCHKASDLELSLTEYDFAILLNSEFWDDANEVQKAALLDHELSHAAVTLDKNGDPARDEESGQIQYRTRGHDIEEFRDVVERHGIYRDELERFAATLADAKRPSLFDADKEAS